MDHVLKMKGTVNTCTSAVIVRNNKILLGLRNYTPDKWKAISVWTTPGGRCDEGELIEENIVRETQEETGITDIVFQKYLGMVPGVKQGDSVYIFLCSSNQEPELKEPEKFSGWQWFAPNEIPDNFINENLLKVLQKEGIAK